MSTGRWTTADIPDLSGRVAVVTGANSGIGLHTSIELARRGATVVLACRDAGRGALARQQVPGRSELRTLDLADLGSVRRFATGLAASHPQVDLLVNNAGVMALPQRRTSVDGFELQLATNHLGHFALTGLLLPLLVAAGTADHGQPARPARVVTVSSMAHRGGRIDLADLDGERHYRSWLAYGQSKLANLLFTLQLQRFADQAGLHLLSVAAHPGLAATELVTNGPARGRRSAPLLAAASRLLSQSSRAGAAPTLRAATDPDVRGGQFYGPSHLGGWRGPPVLTTAAAAAHDVQVAEALWQRSTELTGVRYEAGAAPTTD